MIFGVAAVGAAFIVSANPADARYHRYYAHYARHAGLAPHAVRGYRHFYGGGYAPPTSSIVVDGNSGQVLEASNAEGTRHPASLTKIMTLYLLFERLEAGKIRLDTQLRVSEHAAEQAPTKLGLRPGSTIAVEDAIKAVVTKSANDAAVTIAENLGGDEDSFAKLMTEKAHALGMSRTTYVNASGLPDDDQNTTAQDQALLGRAIQERFPRYYKYFSTEEFVYRGHAMRNHNHLLGVVGGVDGIKTGYTRASGFNLVTSVHRNGRFIIAVVLGGRSSYERDMRVRELINAHIGEASLQHTAAAVAERAEPRADPKPVVATRTEQRGEQKPVAFLKAPLTNHADPAPAVGAKMTGGALVGTGDSIQPVPVKTITYRTAPMQTSPLAPMPAVVPAAVPPQPTAGALPRPTAGALPPPQPTAAALPQPPAAPLPQPTAAIAARATSARPPADWSNAVVIASDEPAAITTATRTVPAKTDLIKEPARYEPPKAEPAVVATVADPAKAEPTKSEVVKSEPAKPEAARADAPRTEIARAEPTPAQIRARGGWIIQIGAYEGEDEARQHLSEAKLKIPSLLAGADSFTERVQKGDRALYRARFAGFDRTMAEAACRQLKRSDMACITVRN
jgi:D-alanyl-D-alanine carboxypeptidase